MTNHRANDLSYGHVGETTYDIDEKSWFFSRAFSNDQQLQPLNTLRQCLPPTIGASDSESVPAKHRSNAHKAQARWLKDNLPQAQCYAPSIVDAGKEHFKHGITESANLLSLGRITDEHGHVRRVLAFPCGPSGHVLRIVKPRLAHHRWEGHASPRVMVLDPSTTEDAYWIGLGGSILQVSFAMDSAKPSSWLAVRKAEYTAILRPFYNHQSLYPTATDFDISPEYPSSRLNCNPVLTIKREQTGFARHADITFNPWYVRQFAIIDEAGKWSIWDIGGKTRKIALHRKSGSLLASTDTTQNAHQSADDNFRNLDSWARILWIADLKTILVCNRQKISVFDFGGLDVTRIDFPTLIDPHKPERILDITRSPSNLHQFVVLTSARIFWMELDRRTAHAPTLIWHVNILLSCKHFRNADDDSMKVTFTNVDEMTTVLVYSNRDPHISTFHLSSVSDSTLVRTCQTSSFMLRHANSANNEPGSGQTLYVIPALLATSPDVDNTGPGKMYAENQVDFMQILSLTSDLALSEMLCSTTLIEDGQRQETVAPTSKTVYRNTTKKSSKRVMDDFIILDDIDIEEIIPRRDSDSRIAPLHQYDRKQAIDARAIYKMAFSNDKLQSTTPDQRCNPAHIEAHTNAVEQRISDNIQGSFTALEVASTEGYRIDIDEANSVLSGFFNSLARLEDPESMFRLSTSIIDSGIVTVRGGDVNKLLDIYDSLVGSWISSLAPAIPSRSRLLTEKLIRSAAIDICLSSIIMTLGDKAADIIVPDESQRDSQTQETADYLRQSSQHTLLSQYVSTPADSLPTPTPTASVATQSRAGSYVSQRSTEDTSISHLRNYAVSMKDQPPITAPLVAVLGQWSLGSDPSTFNWRETRAALTLLDDQDGDEEDIRRIQKEEQKRRKRAERTLRKQREQNFLSASQPVIFGSQPLQSRNSQLQSQSQVITPFASFDGVGAGSQPDSRPFYESQGAEDISMTQPIAGLFGSRTSKRPGKPKKKRVKGF